MFYGSTFNSVTLRWGQGNVSSCNKLFRSANIKTINFEPGDGVAIVPRDISGCFEFNKILVNHPNNIDYSNANIVSYTWEGCSKLTEIPSYYTVTDEASRLTTEANIIGCKAIINQTSNYGITNLEQAFNGCSLLRKVGPVLDMKGVSSTPYLTFGGCNSLEDIRLKNLNCSLDLQSAPMLDIPSIKYCLENLYTQPSGTIKDIVFPTTYINSIVDKSQISSELIQSANTKGWIVYSGDIEITPDLTNVNVEYRFSFNDWEVNTAYNNDIEVSDHSVIIKKFRPNMWILRSSENLNNSALGPAFANTKMTITGNSAHSDIYTSSYYSNGAVGGDGGTMGSIRGVGILPYSMHSTPTNQYAPELPYSAYIWDSCTYVDGSTAQIASELTSWRGDWSGSGYNCYGYVYDKKNQVVFPNISTFATPYNPYRLSIGVYTGAVHTFDRWWSDNTTLASYITKEGPYKIHINSRRDATSTLTSRWFATQERFTNLKFRFSGLVDGDYIKWSHTSSTITDMDGNIITEITADGDYLITNSGVEGGFIPYNADASITSPITIEILDNPEFIDSEGYIDISDNPIIIRLNAESISV